MFYLFSQVAVESRPTTETIDTPSREGLQHPGDLFAELDEYQEDSHFEIYGMYELE